MGGSLSFSSLSHMGKGKRRTRVKGANYDIFFYFRHFCTPPPIFFSEANLCNMSVGRSGVIKIHTTGGGGGGKGLLFSFKKAFLKTSSIRPRFSRIPVCYKTGGKEKNGTAAFAESDNNSGLRILSLLFLFSLPFFVGICRAICQICGDKKEGKEIAAN